MQKIFNKVNVFHIVTSFARISSQNVKDIYETNNNNDCAVENMFYFKAGHTEVNSTKLQLGSPVDTLTCTTGSDNRSPCLTSNY